MADRTESKEYDVESLFNEVQAAIDVPGELHSWADGRLDGSIDSSILEQLCVRVTDELLISQMPQAASWERFVVTLAHVSKKSRHQLALQSCATAIDRLRELAVDGRLADVAGLKVVTLAGALTVVLAAQERLKQHVEQAVLALCDAFPDLLDQMAQPCQDIWKRHGQMTGGTGLFYWDTRRREWRLAQDFKAYRPGDPRAD